MNHISSFQNHNYKSDQQYSSQGLNGLECFLVKEWILGLGTFDLQDSLGMAGNGSWS